MKLSPKQRDKLMWLYLHGLHIPETARLIGITDHECSEAIYGLLKGSLWWEPSWQCYMEGKDWTAREEEVLMKMRRDHHREWNEIGAVLGRLAMSCKNKQADIEATRRFAEEYSAMNRQRKGLL